MALTDIIICFSMATSTIEFETGRYGAESHVLAKRVIYKKYLQAFIPSMLTCRTCTRLTIFDGFAGSGRENTEDWPAEIEHYGCPIIALRVALHHFKRQGREDASFDTSNDRVINVDAYLSGIEDLQKNTSSDFKVDQSNRHKIVFVFAETNSDLYKELAKNVIQVIKRYRLRVDAHPDFEHGICKVLCDFRGTKRPSDEYLVACYIINADFTQMAAPSGHCLANIDPPVYTEAPLDKIRKFVGPKRQLFLNLASKDAHIIRSSTTDSLTSDIIQSVIRTYEPELRNKAQTELALSLEIQSLETGLKCHIFFLTNHVSSFKSIKNSMDNVRENSRLLNIRFKYKSVGLADPHTFSSNYMEDAIASAIHQRFRRKGDVTLSVVERFVWLETPFVFRKTPLRRLEEKCCLIVKTNKPRTFGTFPDYTDWSIEFV